MSALFQVTYSIQSISLLILAPNEKKNVVKSLLSHQLSLVSLTGLEEHMRRWGICPNFRLKIKFNKFDNSYLRECQKSITELDFSKIEFEKLSWTKLVFALFRT